MKGELIYKILKTVGEEMLDNIAFVEAILVSGYGASSSKIRKEYLKIREGRSVLQEKNLKIIRFKKYLSKLKKEGLVLENKSKKLYLSDKGKRKLDSLQGSFSLNKDSYVSKVKGGVVMVSYDIPMAFNRERKILRSMLRVFDFELVHKSVWVGKLALTERFMLDLNRMGIADYVEILEVTKNGTLKKEN